LRIDLHNHTYLCNHSEGTVSEFVEQAIREKIDIFGFSDHNPMSFDPKYRMKFEELSLYFKMVDEVREKYRGKIQILKGFEVDYLPKYHDKRVLNSDVDYLIGSIHFLEEWGFDNPEFIGRYKTENIDLLWKKYFKEVQNMAESGLFQIVGHIDLMKVFKFLPKENRIEDLIEPTLKSIKKSGMAVEINGAGYRKPIGEPYPKLSIIKMLYDLKIPITFGSDAHSPNQVGKFLSETEKVAQNIGYQNVAIFRNKKMEMVKIV